MSDDAYLNGAMLLLDIEKRFDEFEAQYPDQAARMIEKCKVQLKTIRPYASAATPASGATTIIGHLTTVGMISDRVATYAMIFIGAMMRAETADASS